MGLPLVGMVLIGYFILAICVVKNIFCFSYYGSDCNFSNFYMQVISCVQSPQTADINSLNLMILIKFANANSSG